MEDTKSIQKTLGNFWLDYSKLFKTFSVAIGHNKLLIAFTAVAILGLVGFVMDLNRTVKTSAKSSIGLKTELDVYALNAKDTKPFIKLNAENDKAGVFGTTVNFISRNFTSMVFSLLDWKLAEFFTSFANIGKAFMWAIMHHPFYSIIYMLIFLTVMSIAGGAISRIAALELARGDKLGALEAIRFSKSKFISLFSAPLLPICIVIMLGIAVFLLGLLGNIPVIGEILVSIFLILAFILGSLMTLVVIGALTGGSMMYPVIAYENSDSFDVISRTFSYVYTKPWHLAFYYISSLVFGAICYIFVRFFAFVILSVIYSFLWLSSFTNGSQAQNTNKLEVIWPGPEFLNLAGVLNTHPMNWSESISAFLVQISVSVVIGLVGAFVVSFFFCSSTTIYALMRKQVDNVNINSIHLDHPVGFSASEDEK